MVFPWNAHRPVPKRGEYEQAFVLLNCKKYKELHLRLILTIHHWENLAKAVLDVDVSGCIEYQNNKRPFLWWLCGDGSCFEGLHRDCYFDNSSYLRPPDQPPANSDSSKTAWKLSWKWASGRPALRFCFFVQITGNVVTVVVWILKAAESGS